MNRSISRGLQCALFVGGLTLLGTTAAHAANTSGEEGVLAGTQATASAGAPISVVGTAVSVVGDSTSVAPAAPAVAPVPAAAPAPAPAPVASPAPVPTSALAPVEPPAPMVTSGDDGAIAGNQVVADIVAPMIVSGNSITVIGDSTTGTGTGTGTATDPITGRDAAGPATSGDDSVAGGNQVAPGLTAPIDITGNAITVVGDSRSAGSGTGARPASGGAEGSTSGDDSIAGGNPITPAITAPVTVGGNAVTVIGDSTTGTGAGTGGTGIEGPDAGSGEPGTGSGTGTGAPIPTRPAEPVEGAGPGAPSGGSNDSDGTTVPAFETRPNQVGVIPVAAGPVGSVPLITTTSAVSSITADELAARASVRADTGAGVLAFTGGQNTAGSHAAVFALMIGTALVLTVRRRTS